MHSATRLDDLKILDCFLQNALHAHLGRIIPFRIQCLHKEDTLWVMAQHPADVVIDIPDIFRVLERALQAEEPKTSLAVKLYLRREGSKDPYSHQSFIIYPLVKKTVTGEAAPAMTGIGEDRIALERNAHFDRLRQSSDIDVGKSLQSADDNNESNPTPSTMSEIISVGNNRSQITENRIVKIDADAFVADFEDSFGNTANNEDSGIDTSAKKSKNMIIPMLGGLGLLAVGSGAGYMGSRPCVLSVCTELNTATALTQSSLTTIDNPAVTGLEVLTAQKQLHQSIDNLKSIPAWSGSYDAAQKSLQSTTAQSVDLDTTVTAMNKAFKAAIIVKNPPLPLLKWQESKQMWTESIDSLGKISSTSPIYPLARRKLTDYQGKSVDIDRRIEAETTGDKQLTSAKDGIKLAIQSQLTATSLPQLRMVKTQWTQVNDQLTSIPANTNAYAQAQDLLKSHQIQIASAQEKVLEEDKAIQNYQAAVKLAEAAKISQKNNRLVEAVSLWNQSVVSIQSVPQTSVIYVQAKPLVFEYTKSFQAAEAKLRDTQKLTLASQDLQKTCAGNPQICTYTINNKAIVVRLMSLYTQTLTQTANAASNQRDNNARTGIINHVNTLGNALQTISENAKLPLEIYGADGKQIQKYRP